MKFVCVLGWMVIMLCLSGCSGSQNNIVGSGTIPVAVLLNTTQSPLPGSVADAVWITDPQKLNSAVAEQIYKADPSQNRQTALWSHGDGILIIQMGQQPTGGYELTLASTTATVTRGVAIVSVEWHRPKVGAIVPQVISSPCLILKMPRQGLKSIDVIDQEGHLRARADVKD